MLKVIGHITHEDARLNLTLTKHRIGTVISVAEGPPIQIPKLAHLTGRRFRGIPALTSLVGWVKGEGQPRMLMIPIYRHYLNRSSRGPVGF